jgi:hypothetical protein
MKHSHFILISFLLLSSPVNGQSERPETIIVPVTSLGDVSDIRKQILQNTLEDELKSYFRLVPQEKYEEVLEQVFEELEYEECSEDTCIMRVQEMLQVENVFLLQVIGEGKDTQLSLGWRTLDEKRKEEEFCRSCGTYELREMIGGLVEKLVGGKMVEPVVLIRSNDSELKKKKAEELKKKKAEELKKKKAEELKKKKAEELKKKQEEEKIKLLIPHYNTRKLSIFAGYCSTRIEVELVGDNDYSSLDINKIEYSGFSIGGRYYIDKNYFLYSDLCWGNASRIDYEINDDRIQHSANILSGTTNNISLSLNYSWHFNAHSFYGGGGISSISYKLKYYDSISNLNHNIDENSLSPNFLIGYDFIYYTNSTPYIINVYAIYSAWIKLSSDPLTQNNIEITNNNNKYISPSRDIGIISIGRSF